MSLGIGLPPLHLQKIIVLLACFVEPSCISLLITGCSGGAVKWGEVRWGSGGVVKWGEVRGGSGGAVKWAGSERGFWWGWK